MFQSRIFSITEVSSAKSHLLLFPVTPSVKEPVPGWVDNLNGPVGLLIGGGKGVIRTMHCKAELLAQLIPVDFAINGIIVVTSKVGKMTERLVELC